MGRADLHIHSIHSWDGTATVEEILWQARFRSRLDVVAVTDHDEIAGSLRAVELAPQFGIEAVPGVEVTTADGHLLALFVDRPIARGRPLANTVQAVGNLGGLCIAPHPMAWRTPSLSAEVIRSVLQEPDLARVLVGIEVWNGGLVRGGSNRRAQALANDLDVAQVGNSDAHLTWSIGFAATRFHGSTADDLRRALELHATEALLVRRTSGSLYLVRWSARKATMAVRSRLGMRRSTIAAPA